MRVALNVQLVRNQGVGGIQSAITGLVSALGRLDDGPEEYVIIGAWQDPDWLGPFLGPNQRIVRGPRPDWAVERRAGAGERLKRLLGPLRPAARRAWRRLFPKPPARPVTWPEVPVSDGFYEALGCDVIHFPWQKYVVCGLPTVFTPHDLQHLHWPEFFGARRVAEIEALFPVACRLAQTVVAVSRWVKGDLVRQYALAPGKVQVIPWAPPTSVYPDPTEQDLDGIRAKYGLPPGFAFYPAMTWPHKNHVRLLQALALLRSRHGLALNLVCTGAQHAPAWGWIAREIEALGLQGQVRFLGMVAPEEVRALYRLASFVVMPSLFEGAGLPVLEAFAEGVPVACSDVTSLPEMAGDAALLFDPLSVESLVDALWRMGTDADLRRLLRERGRRRLQAFSWDRTAKAHRAVYRRAARRPLTEEDRWLLEWDWVANPDAAPVQESPVD